VLNADYLILRRSDHEIRLCRQQVLRALVIQETIESREPEGHPSAVLSLT